MPEMSERCFRNGIDVEETLDTAIELYSKPKPTNKDQSNGQRLVDELLVWFDRSKDCIADDMFKKIRKTLNDSSSIADSADSKGRDRILENLYGVRRTLRTPFGITKRVDNELKIIDPWSGDVIPDGVE